MLGMILALLLDETPNPKASPPPTIITTRTSPLCKAVREYLAPAIFALNDQDLGLNANRAMLSGDEIVHMHVENSIDRLAQDNIKANQMLDKLVILDLHDRSEKGDLSKLERALRQVAKLQNDALNQISGTEYTNDFEALLNHSNPMAGEDQLSWHAPRLAPPIEMPFAQSMEGRAARNLAILGDAIARQEATATPLLQAVVDRCT